MSNLGHPLQSIAKLKLTKADEIVLKDRKTGLQFYCKKDSFHIFCETWFNRDYDVLEVPIGKDDIVIDVGANHGFFSCYAASKGATVWAFEPSGVNFTTLRRNIQLNQFSDYVVCHNEALGSFDGPVQLFRLPQLGGAMHTIQPNFASAYHPEFDSVESEEVSQKNLEMTLRDNGYPRIRLLKLDCEGSELEILKSLSPESLQNIDCIVMEFHPVYGFNELVEIGFENNFHVSLANNLPWASRQIIKMVNKRIWQEMLNFPSAIN